MLKRTSTIFFFLFSKDEYEELDDEEEYKEDSYKHEDAAIPSEAAEYDEGTKQLLEQAKQAREEYGEVEGRFHDVQNRIREFEGSIQTDYGHADVFMPLHGQCFDYSDREYTYRFCPFDRASQIPKNGGSEISLGYDKINCLLILSVVIY